MTSLIKRRIYSELKNNHHLKFKMTIFPWNFLLSAGVWKWYFSLLLYWALKFFIVSCRFPKNSLSLYISNFNVLLNSSIKTQMFKKVLKKKEKMWNSTLQRELREVHSFQTNQFKLNECKFLKLMRIDWRMKYL